MKYLLYIVTGLFLLNGISSCRKSYDPGDWNLVPDRPQPKPEEPDNTPTMTFKVMSLNMNLGNNTAWLAEMQQYIKEYDPDFLFLRQVDSSTTRSSKIDRPKVIADAMKMNVLFKKNIDYQTGGFGNAVLSKFPIKEKVAQFLRREEGNNAELRSVVMIKAEVAPGHDIYFGGTELDPAAGNRALQVVDLLNLTDKLTAPSILVGNLNEQESANGPALTYLKGSFTFGCLGTGCAWNAPKANPNGVYDYIMFRDKNDLVSFTEYGAFPKSASTFLPMVAKIKLKLKE